MDDAVKEMFLESNMFDRKHLEETLDKVTQSICGRRKFEDADRYSQIQALGNLIKLRYSAVNKLYRNLGSTNTSILRATLEEAQKPLVINFGPTTIADSGSSFEQQIENEMKLTEDRDDMVKTLMKGVEDATMSVIMAHDNTGHDPTGILKYAYSTSRSSFHTKKGELHTDENGIPYRDFDSLGVKSKAEAERIVDEFLASRRHKRKWENLEKNLQSFNRTQMSTYSNASVVVSGVPSEDIENLIEEVKKIYYLTPGGVAQKELQTKLNSELKTLKLGDDAKSGILD